MHRKGYHSRCVFIYRSVDPTLPNKFGTTPLIAAAKCNRTHNIKVLMDCKMENTNAFGDDDDGDEDNDAESEQEEELQPRVNINAKDKSSYTALHHAAKRGHLVRTFFSFLDI